MSHTPAPGARLRSRHGRDGSGLTFQTVGGDRVRPDNQPEVYVVSGIRRAVPGPGPRWNGRPNDAISFSPWSGLATATVYPMGVALSTSNLARTVRYLVVLVAGLIAGSRTVQAAHSWQEWHAWAGRDPSGADAYRTFFLVNTAVALLSVAIAGLVWWLLKPCKTSGTSR
jgi:hypothetical protein